MYSNMSYRTAILDVLCLTATRSGASRTNQVRLSYSLTQTQTTVGEPICLRVLMENDLSEGVILDLGVDFSEHFHAKLSRPDGRIDKIPGNQVERFGIPGVLLGAHSSGEKRLLLNQWFTIDTAGHYFLDISLAKLTENRDR